MRRFNQVSWFRLFVVVGLSLVTSMAMYYGDERLTRGEIFTTILQSAIVAFSFLQCPETSDLERRVENDNNKQK